MIIDTLTVQRIKAAAKIEEVVSDYISLRRRGSNLIGLCPFHNEKTPSFNVNPSRNIFKCFGCGKGGSPVDFVMEIEHLGYSEALRLLARKYNIEIQERELTDEERRQQSERESMLVLNSFARDFYVENLHSDEGSAVALSYLRQRGTSDEMIRLFQLGYSPDDGNRLPAAAKAKGFKAEFLTKTGLCIDNARGLYDRFHSRVIFPFHDVTGKVIGFGGRIMKKADNTGKYVNSPQSEVFDKSQTLYGIYQSRNAIAKADRVYMVEGYFDVISMHQSGVQNVVASSGTSLTTNQVRQLKRFTSNITVMYDGDPAGIHASMRGIDMLLQDGFNVRVVTLPEGDDPDSFAQRHTSEELVDYLDTHSEDFIRFKAQLGIAEAGDDPVKQARMISDIVQSISVIPDNITRGVYIRECSSLLHISEENLWIKHNDIAQKRHLDQQRVEQREQRLATTRVAATPTVANANKQAASDTAATTPFYKEERELLRCLVNYGNVIAIPVEGEDAQGQPVAETWTIADFIDDELQLDNIRFHDELFQRFYDEIIAYCSDPGHLLRREDLESDDFRLLDEKARVDVLRRQSDTLAAIERHFASLADNDLSRLAIELCENRYTLTDSQLLAYADLYGRLPAMTRNLVWTLKRAIVDQRLHELTPLLMTTTDPDEKRTMHDEYTNLVKAKKKLGNLLGRTVK